MSTVKNGYGFPSPGGGPALSAPAPSAASAPQVICPGRDTRFPPLDSRLVTPETREEMVNGVRMETMASEPPHGDSHFNFSAVLSALLRPGYVGSVDMLTRYSQGDDFAADISIRRDGEDPLTKERYLEELVFEIGNTQRLSDLAGKAVNMTRRGVRRIIAVLIQKPKAFEWAATLGQLVPIDSINGAEAIADPATLIRPLPLALILLIARGASGQVSRREVQAAVDNFVAESLDAQGNPVLRRIREESRTEGHTQGMAQLLLRVLGRRGVAVDDLSRRRILGCTDQAMLERWADNAATATRLEDVLL